MRVLLRHTFFISIFEPGVINAPTVKNAADEGSEATYIFFANISMGPLMII